MKLERMTKENLIKEIEKLKESIKINEQQLNGLHKQMIQKDKILSIIAGKDNPEVLVRKAALYDLYVNKNIHKNNVEQAQKEIDFFERIMRLSK